MLFWSLQCMWVTLIVSYCRIVQYDLVILTASKHVCCIHLKRGWNKFLLTLKFISPWLLFNLLCFSVFIRRWVWQVGPIWSNIFYILYIYFLNHSLNEDICFFTFMPTPSNKTIQGSLKRFMWQKHTAKHAYWVSGIVIGKRLFVPVIVIVFSLFFLMVTVWKMEDANGCAHNFRNWN